MKRLIIAFFIIYGLTVLGQSYIYDDTVAYNWINIKSVATTVTWDNTCTDYPDDDDKVVVNIGFTFKFGNLSYTQVRIITNGLLQFDTETGLQRLWTNDCLPSTSRPPYRVTGCPNLRSDYIVAGYWDDLDPSSGGSVYYATIGTAPDRMFVVTWENVPDYFSATNSYTFQIILYEKTGDIKFQYKSADCTGSSATIGVEINNNDYTEYSCNTSSVGAGRAILFCNTYYPCADYHFDDCYLDGFDGDITDSARDFNGRSNSVDTADLGVICKSVDFTADSIEDYVVLPEKVLDGKDSFTVSFWLNTIYTQVQTIVSAANASNSWGNEFTVFFANSTYLLIYVKEYWGGVTINDIADGTWHHFAITRQGDAVSIYLDGTLVSTITGYPTGALSVDPGGLILGQDQDSVGGGFDINQDCQGYVDEVIFFPRALTDTEISDIYSNQSSGLNYDGSSRTCEVCAPNAEWKMDECLWNGTANEVVDSTGNGLDGTAKGDNADGRVAENFYGEYICNSGLFRGEGYTDNGIWYQARYYIEVGDNDLLSPLATDDEITITGWFKTTAASGTIVSKSGTNREFRIFVENGDLKASFYNLYNADFTITVQPGVNDGAWHYFAVSAKLSGPPGSRTLKVNSFFDGVEGSLVQFTSFTDYQNTASPLFIGAMSWTDGSLTDYFDGQIDEIKIFKFYINGTTLNDFYQNESAGNEYDGSLRNCSVCQALAEWRMDNCFWNGTTGEILDASGNGHDGTAYGGANTSSDAVLCNSGYFDNSAGDNQYGQVPDSPDLSPHVGANGEMTLMAWVKVISYPDSTLQGRVPVVAKGDTNNWEYALYIYDWQAVGFSVWNLNGTGYGEPAGGSIPLNEWHHLAGVIKKGQYVRIYMDGNLIAEETNLVGDTGNGSSPLYFARRGSGNHYFNGYIDEVKIFDKALSQTEIQEIMNKDLSGLNLNGTSRVCNTCSTVAYFEITHDGSGIACYPEAIHIRACDAGGNTVTDYVGVITLSTSTGNGTWYTSYTGVTNNDPPQGTLTDNTADDGAATYEFVSADGGEVTLLLKDTHIETLTIYITDGISDSTGHDGGPLTFAASGFVFDTVPNQISGKDFQVTVKTVGLDPQTGDCTIIDYDGAKNLIAYLNYSNPSTGTTNILINGTSVSSNGTAITLTFNSGVCTFTSNYPDAGEISIRLDDTAENITGTSNLFVVKPFGFYVSATGNPAAADANGAVYKQAGEAFELTVSAVNWQSADDADNDGIPDAGADLSDNSITPNYSGTPAVTSILVAPSGGANGSLNPSSVNVSGGSGSETGMTFSEVGIINITATDSDYLGAGSITGETGNVGRFIPASFRFDTLNQNPACSSIFTYGGQNFTLDITVTALNTNGDTTLNYTGTFAKLDNTGFSFTPMVNSTTAGDGTLSAGSFSLSFSNGTASFTVPFVYDWANEHNPENISVKTVATDSDGVTGEGFSNYVTFKYGRLRIENGYSPSDRDLTLNVFAEYYQDGNYLLNSDDNCTVYSDTDITLSNYQGNLNTGETSIISISVILNGQGSLTLSAPGKGNEGSVDLIFTAPSYMRFASGRATFGIYRGNDDIISWEEVF